LQVPPQPSLWPHHALWVQLGAHTQVCVLGSYFSPGGHWQWSDTHVAPPPQVPLQVPPQPSLWPHVAFGGHDGVQHLPPWQVSPPTHVPWSAQVPPQPSGPPHTPFGEQFGEQTQDLLSLHVCPPGHVPLQVPPQPSGAPHTAPAQLGVHAVLQALAMQLPPLSLAVHVHVWPGAHPVDAVPHTPPHASDRPQKAPPGGAPVGGHVGVQGPGQLKMQRPFRQKSPAGHVMLAQGSGLHLPLVQTWPAGQATLAQTSTLTHWSAHACPVGQFASQGT
jgi:hypothetical protein